MSCGHSRLVAVACLVLVSSVAVARAADTPLASGFAAGPALGWTQQPLEDASASSVGIEAHDPPLTVRLVARWSEVESTPGVFDWSELEPTILALDGAGARVVLCLTGTHPLHVPSAGPPSPTEAESLEAWLAFVRSAARTFAGRVDLFEIWERVGEAPHPTDATTYAFLLKSSALAVQAESENAGNHVGVAQGPVALADLEWQRELWEQDVAAYVDVLPVLIDGAAGAEAVSTGLAGFLAESLRHPPATAIWAYVDEDRVAGGEQRAAGAVIALTSGAATALMPADDDAELRHWIVGAHTALSGYAPAPRGELEIEDPSGRAADGAGVLGRFFSATDFTSLVFYREPRGGGSRLVLDAPRVRNTRVMDPRSGEVRRVGSSGIPGKPQRRMVRLRAATYPAAVLFQRAAPGFELPPEELETTGRRELTAEEIIARYQRAQQAQEDALERWTARSAVDMHFKLAQGGATVDVRIESNYFWERGGQIEWEQTDYYLNGNKLSWKKVPELPLIQPEKVVTLPLDLTLDRTYVYRLVGRDRVGEAEAYVLEFRPGDAGSERSLFRGRVWIDAERFVRLKINVVQTNLEAPVLSHEETDHYGELTGPAGRAYRLPTEIRSQQVWKAAGRNFIVLREQTFTDFRINPPGEEFTRRRGEAYASSNQMLRDTEVGIRYLDREADGARTVRWKENSSQLFAGAGAFKDRSTDGVAPLAGVNYFNYNVAGKNLQINAFFAGVLGFFTASDPDLFGSKLDGTLNATVVGIKFDDELFLGPDELIFERIENRPQNVSMQIGIPAGAFWKFSLSGGLSYRQYFPNEEAEAAIEAFNLTPGTTQSLRSILPEDHLEVRGALGVEFNRKGYSLGLSGLWARRSDWEPWGIFDDAGATFVRFDPATASYVPSASPVLNESFTRWGLTGFKEWYLPKFQKLRGEVNYLDGADLDRFSRYQFSLFGDDRLNGFSGSGVRFDEGWIGRAGYSFNLFEAIRFDAVVETARVRDLDAGTGTQSHSGFGLAANFVAPWKSVVSFSWGYALQSDVPDLEGEQEFLLLVLKLF